VSEDEEDEEATSVHRIPDVVVEDALAAVFDELKSLASTPKTRELRARADTYRRTLDQWAHTRPTESQRLALRDLVIKLHAQTVEVRKQGGVAPDAGPPSRGGPTSRR
jgi:hypothetical protein